MSSKYTIIDNNRLLELGLSTRIKKSLVKRNITLSIKNNCIFVSAPSYLSDQSINDFIDSKINWIKKKINEKKNFFKRKKINFLEGDILYLFGYDLSLKLVLGKTTAIYSNNNIIKVLLSRKNINIQALIEKWYKSKSINYLENRTNYYANIMGLKPSYVKIKNFKKRLGSCSIKGEIVFNWKIIMFPRDIIDYIIIHELSHLIYFNHSKNFWNTVEKFCPDFKGHKDWIKNNLEMISW